MPNNYGKTKRGVKSLNDELVANNSFIAYKQSQLRQISIEVEDTMRSRATALHSHVEAMLTGHCTLGAYTEAVMQWQGTLALNVSGALAKSAAIACELQYLRNRNAEIEHILEGK
jgi:hypothetical protein